MLLLASWVLDFDGALKNQTGSFLKKFLNPFRELARVGFQEIGN